MQQFSHLINSVCTGVSVLSSRNALIMSTLFPCMEVEHRTSMYPSVWVCVCVYPPACVHQTAPDLPFLSSLCLTGLPLSPSLQLLVKMDKPSACCHMELINRTGGNKRQFNFNTNKETFRIPPNKTPGRARRTRSLCVCVFFKGV